MSDLDDIGEGEGKKLPKVYYHLNYHSLAQFCSLYRVLSRGCLVMRFQARLLLLELVPVRSRCTVDPLSFE